MRGRVVEERLHAMIEIWTHEKAEFHGDFVNFDPIYSWPKPVTKPYPPLYLGGDQQVLPKFHVKGAIASRDGNVLLFSLDAITWSGVGLKALGSDHQLTGGHDHASPTF